MEKMDEITRRLAMQQPVLKDAEALTESIMANLPPQMMLTMVKACSSFSRIIPKASTNFLLVKRFVNSLK